MFDWRMNVAMGTWHPMKECSAIGPVPLWGFQSAPSELPGS